MPIDPIKTLELPLPSPNTDPARIEIHEWPEEGGLFALGRHDPQAFCDAARACLGEQGVWEDFTPPSITPEDVIHERGRCVPDPTGEYKWLWHPVDWRAPLKGPDFLRGAGWMTRTKESWGR